MTTQTQGKGKKKGKDVMKVSLDEFNQIDAPLGHAVVSVKMATGLDWAETMADHDSKSAETVQLFVPTAPRAQRGPGIDFDSLPNEPPFKVSLYNVPMSAEDKDIAERFFQGLEITHINMTKSSTTVEFATKDALYEALCKHGSSLRGRTVDVYLYGKSPPQTSYSDRYGDRGGSSSYGERGFGGSRMGFGDRGGSYGDRDRSGGFGDRGGSYTDRGPGGFGVRSDRDGPGRGAGGGFGGRSGGFADRFDNFRENNRGMYPSSGGGEPPMEREEPDNWRARPAAAPRAPPPQPMSYNNGSRQSYMHPRSDPNYGHSPQQQPNSESYYPPRYNQYQNQPSNHTPPQYNDRPGSQPRSLGQPSTSEERPKLVLEKRKTPLNIDDVSSVARNEAIFGKAKPSSTPYQKMKEIEEKLSHVQIIDKKVTSPHGSQAGSQPSSAPRSRQISERSTRE